MQASLISNLFFNVNKNKKYRITPIKLQKLLWILQGYYSVTKNHQLITDNFIAHPYGGIIPCIFKKYPKIYAPITKPICDFPSQYRFPEHPDVTDAVLTILEYYGKNSDLYLSEITNSPNGAWFNAYSLGIGTIILYEDIHKEFNGKMTI